MTNPYFHVGSGEYPTRDKSAGGHGEPSPYAAFSDRDIERLLEAHGAECERQGCALRAHLCRLRRQRAGDTDA